MRQRTTRLGWLRHMLLGGLAAAVMASGAPTEIRAGSLTVNTGYDLFSSGPGTTFPGLGSLVGVPLGTFDFGSGPVSTVDADTIVHRLDTVTVAAIGDTGTTRLEMNALQLATAAPVDFGGFGLDTYYVTLQSARGGPATVGSMDITFNSLDGGTFSSFFDVFFDIRKGSLNGPIVFSNTDALRLTNDGTDWNRIPPPDALLIGGVNFHLNGQNNDTDFWPVTPFNEVHPDGAVHEVNLAHTPEPASWLTGATAVVIGLGWARRRRSA